MSAKSETAVQACSKNEAKKEKKPVNIRISLFFDGTGNNQTNTAHRLANDDVYRGWRLPGGSGSYENDFSNVARLSQTLTENSAGFDRHFKIYVEGIGTQDGGRDIPQGMATGNGITGIEEKVRAGLDRALSNAARVPNPDKLIQTLRLDVFGFSRGAAAARHCIHAALFDARQQLQKRLQAQGFQVSKVEVHFAGLFDTVASFGFNITNDTAELHLDAIAHATTVLHLAADDEHRAKFPLTNIRSKGATEISLPGVHSDVGGGYVAVCDELNLQVLDFDVMWESAAKKVALRARFDRERRWLIGQGWCEPGEIAPPTWNNELCINRRGILNTYNRIPLQIMKTWATEGGLTFTPAINARFSVPAAAADLVALKNILGPRGQGNWRSQTALLRRIRHRYFHFSSRYGDIGMGPQFTNDDPMNGVRQRTIHHG